MSINFKNTLNFLFLFVLIIFTQSASAVSPIYSRVPLPGYVASDLGPFYVNPAAFPSSSSHVVQAPFDIQTSKGPVVSNVPVTVNANVSRVGKAVATFAKRVGPIGTGIAVAQLVCDLSGICSENGSWVKSAGPSIGTYEPSCLFVNSGTGCIDMGQYIGGSGMESTCAGYTAGATLNVAQISGVWHAICVLPAGYSPSGGGSPTDSDWYSAETVLSSAQFISHLSAAGEPVPVDAPVVSPVTLTSSSTDVVNYDSAGNPVSTTTTTTVQQITPAPLVDDPLRVQVDEQTTVVTKDPSGNVISSSVTNISQAPIKFPDDYNREVTQQSVDTTLKHIDNSDGQSLPEHDPAAVASQVTQETQKSVDLINGVKEPSAASALTAMFQFFVWTPPSVACTNPSFQYKGNTFAPDFCTPAGYVQEALGFFFALFGAWNIYGLFFRKSS